MGGARERGIRMIYSFRTLPLMKGCRWMTYHLRVHTIMTRFRLGISDIFVHHYRYKRHTYKDMICPLCRVAKETICSVLPCAKNLYSAICKFLLIYLLLSLLLASTNEYIVRNLSVYLYKAFKLRSISSS